MEIEAILIIDKRMLEVPDLLKRRGMIRFKKQWLEALGMERQNVQKIKDGQISFTRYQVLKACSHFKINANWLLGLEKNEFRK